MVENKKTAARDIGKLLVVGAAAGTANGLFGAGGGLIAVPLLIGWLKLPEKNAYATSLAVMVPISMVSLTVYFLRGGLVVADMGWYLLGGVVGGGLAGILFRRIPVQWLRWAMAGFLLYGGVKAVLLL
ncbi:MAG: sulfite exporter TauE/SafE family protein [Ruminococcaceae bacterium]|nr:sulfite exporter TauE/SafE family protein [Oscillospiraceae bacterium]